MIAVASETPRVEELLDEAISRGWIDARGDVLSVSPRGRREAEDYLDRMRL